MKKYLAQLRPLERRLAIGVLVMMVLVLNYLLVWPHFSDWGKLRHRLAEAQGKLKIYQAAIAQAPAYEAQVKSLQSQGEFVAPEDMSANLLHTIQMQSAESGVGIVSASRQITHADGEFFIEQVQNITVIADDKQLVDFLYKLCSGTSMIRVRDLELQPDAPKQHLNANIQLVASYQKNAAAGNLKSATAKAK
jgi:Tfp pilus assembly protein PilO